MPAGRIFGPEAELFVWVLAPFCSGSSSGLKTTTWDRNSTRIFRSGSDQEMAPHVNTCASSRGRRSLKCFSVEFLAVSVALWREIGPWVGFRRAERGESEGPRRQRAAGGWAWPCAVGVAWRRSGAARALAAPDCGGLGSLLRKWRRGSWTSTRSFPGF